MKALVLTGVVVLSLAGCTSSARSDSQSRATHPAAASGAAAQASASPLAMSAEAACARSVPGSQHAVRTTVAAVRQVGIGIQGPSPRVKQFAVDRAAAGDPAYFCYRFVSTKHLDEWWATTGNGSTLLLVGIGGVTKDRGVFDNSSLF